MWSNVRQKKPDFTKPEKYFFVIRIFCCIYNNLVHLPFYIKRMRFIFLAVFTFLIIISIAGNTDIDKTKQAKEWLKNQPLAFIENKGQFTNSDGKPADNVLFKASYGDCDIYITTEGLSYVYVKYEEKPQKSRDTNDFRKLPGEKAADNKTVSYYRMDMNLQGSTINKAQILKELPGKQGVTNYFYPHCPDGIYGVQEYGKITIKNIYKGIDWVIYTNAGNKEAPLKYDFVVQPQANYKDIRIKFVNAQNTSLADNGKKLKIQTIAGSIEEGNLYSYLQNSTEKQAIKTNYVANEDSTLQFELGTYDKTKTLVIDPLVWATYYGKTSNMDQLASVCVDHQDNVYITGKTFSRDYPTQQLTGAYWQPINDGTDDADAVIIKFDNKGVLQWSTYYGGSYDDGSAEYGNSSICADSQDNIYIVGTSVSQDLPVQPMAGAYFQLNVDTWSFQVFILKFNKQGVRQWATYFGGSNWEDAASVKADKDDNIYITGITQSTDFPTKELPGAYWQPLKGDFGDDIFISKFNSQGACLWATYYGGSEKECNWGSFGGAEQVHAPSICIDNKNHVYITGSTTSYNFPTLKSTCTFYKAVMTGWMDAFLLKFDMNGVRQWATFIGGDQGDLPTSICSDHMDNVYITGHTASSDFPTKYLAGAFYQTNYQGGDDIFIVRVNNRGDKDWATYYGGNDFDAAYSICSDNQNNIYIAANAYSSNMPTTYLEGQYWQPKSAGSDDAFLLQFNNKGVCKWATYYGGIQPDRAIGTVSDSQNSIYFIADYLTQGAHLVDYGNGAYYDDHTYSNGILKFKYCNNQKPTSLLTDRDNICILDNGVITLTAIGGMGDTLKWYSDKAGLNYLGKYSPFTVPVPSQTTTYYARWESLCDTSECDSAVVNILTQITKSISPVICEGDTCTVGTSKYIKAGIYTDLLSTASGCDSIVTTNLLVNPAIQIVTNPLICEGETYTVGSNGYTSAGTYRDVLETYLGCDSTVVTNLVVNPTNHTPLTRFICQGESYIVGTRVHTTTGIYSDTLSSVLFCDSIVTTNLTVNPAYQTTPSPFICPGEALTVGTHTYNASGIYIDKLSTIVGCDSIITTNLTVYPVEQNIQSPNKCTGESITVGLNTYTETGTYTDVLTSSHNCDSTIITNLTVNPTVQTPVTESICEGESFIVGPNNYSVSGNYIDVLKTSLGCDSTVTTNLTVNPVPDVSLGDDQLLCPGDSIILSPGIGFSSYLWSDGSVMNHLKVNKTGTYSVTAFNDWCPASAEVTIRECGAELWFPNAFSPNNDYNNDTFKPVILGTLKTFQILIYNRWGQLLYESNDAYSGWDGIFKGSLCPAAQYVFIASYSMGTEPSDQKQRIQRGMVTLVR